MKRIKLILLLMIIALNQCISNVESSKILGTYMKIKSEKSNFEDKKTQASSDLARHTSTNLATFKSKSKTKLILSVIMLITNSVTKIGSDIMTHYINKMNQASLDIMKTEQQNNEETLTTMKTKEIESCAQIKLIIQTNKHFFLLTQFKSIFFRYYSERLNFDFENKKLTANGEKEIALYTKTFDDISILRNSLGGIEQELMDSLQDIENDLCSQEASYADFEERNEILEGKIGQMEKLLEEKEDSFIGTLLTGGSRALKNYIDKDILKKKTEISEFMADTAETVAMSDDEYGKQAWKDLVEEREKGNEQSDSDATDKGDFEKSEGSGTIRWQDTDIVKTIGTFGVVFGRLGELRNSLKAAKEDGLLKGGANIMAKAFNLVAAVFKLIESIPNLPELKAISAILGAAFKVIAKLIELIIAGVEYYKITKEEEEYFTVRDEFYKSLSEFGASLLELLLSGFSSVAVEGFTFFKKIVDLVSAYKRKKQNTLEMNFYKTLSDVKIQDQNNMNKFNICLANFLSMKSRFETILELNQGEGKMLNTMVQASKTLMTTVLSQSAASHLFFEAKGKAILKEEINSICNKNIQFCARNFDKQLFTDLGFKKDELKPLIDLSVDGPFTDIVVSTDAFTSLSFIQLGYEPIAENLYGCRLCSNGYVIRHVEIISEKTSDKMTEKKAAQLLSSATTRGENLVEGMDKNGNLISKSLYHDDTGDTIKDYSQFKSIRLDTKHVVYYEIIRPKTAQLALNKLLYFSKKIPKIEDWTPVINAELIPWDPVNRKWNNCALNKCNISIEYPWLTFMSYKPLADSSNLKIINQKIHENLTKKSQKNLLLLPIGGIEDKILPDRYLSDEGKTLSFLVCDDEKMTTDSTQIIINYIKKKLLENKKPNTYSMKKISIKTNNYNWIIKNSKIKKADLINKMNMQIETKNIIDIPFIRTYKKNGVVLQLSDLNLEYYLVQFEPFTTLQINYKETQTTITCDSVCTDKNVPATSNQCSSMDMSFNNWKKLELIESNPEIYNLFSEKHPLYHVKCPRKFIGKRIITNESTQAPFYTISFNNRENHQKNFDFTDTLIYVKHFLIENSIEKINGLKVDKQRYLVIKKEIYKEPKTRKYDQLNFWIKTKKDLESFNIDLKTEDFFIIRLSDIDENFYVMALKKQIDKTEVTNYLEKFKIENKGYVMVDRTIIRKDNINNDDYLVVFIKPLPSSGFLSSNDLIESKFLKSDIKCKNDFYSSINDGIAIKNGFSRVSGDEFDYLEPSNKEPSYRKPFDFYYENFSSLNLSKVMYRKLFPYTGIDKVSVDNFFNPNSKLSLFKNCDKLEFLYPMIFKLTKEEEKGWYRRLEIDPTQNNSIVHKLSNKGPGIKSIYWLGISSIKKITTNSRKTLEEANNFGFSLFKETTWQLTPKIKLYVKIYVSYDYRIKIDKKEICMLCQKVKGNEEKDLLNVNLTGVEKLLANIKHISKKN